MNIESGLRTLAKTNKYQTIYSHAKEFGLKLFENEIDYSDVQIKFLNCLSFYSEIHTDIALGDIEDIVLKEEIYEEAWMYYKNKKRSNDTAKAKASAVKKDDSKQEGSTWVMKLPKKRN